ncbi:ankyrin repeat and KH domain-containing protein 1-like [Mytilus californianus]|uniref:ankyrin repeat and KH domain-containing protein 1-like n=1 Tax=Mytilus californianus TaxID=6549 RepID=UPI0022483033|nr:ankyrin repeat and KH domain-containing protein 1-like [Mytilus californianus]
MTIRYGYTPLFAACQRKYYEIVDMLLEEGANINKALYDACRESYLDTVKFLLQNGATVNSIGRFGQTALYGACIGGCNSIVKFLIDQGANIETKVKRANVLDETTCLHAAYLCGNRDIIQLLINSGASVDTVGNFGRTLLHKACREGNYEIVKILIDKGVDINASDMYGVTPLIACVLQNIDDSHVERESIPQMRKYEDDFDQLHEDYVHQLKKYKPSDFIAKYNVLTENHYKVIQLLKENGASFNKVDQENRASFSLSWKIDDLKYIGFLLSHEFLPINHHNFQDLGDDVKRRIINTKDDNGITSFLVSCLRGYEELVDLFISAGADVDARNGWFTPLTAACRDGHLGTVEILLDNGSTVNQTNIDGETPLYTACICGHYGWDSFEI